MVKMTRNKNRFLAIGQVLVAFGFLLATNNAFAQTPKLLDTVEFRAQSLAALPRWVSVLEKVKLERPEYELCAKDADNCPLNAMVGWQDKIKALQGKSLTEQMTGINDYANAYPYRNDIDIWGLSDYWESPKEFLARSGDCEDYSIIKFFSLRALGVPNDRLRLVVVQDTVRNIAHAVLAVYDGSQVYILDSLFSAVLKQEFVKQYKPYYSVNETTRWAHLVPKTTVRR
jgi:predicted transglutaminase-like cysteine proteinase